MSSQKLSRMEIMHNVKINREIERLKHLKYTRKMDDKDVAYIDRMIPDDLVEKVIMPTIKASPYQAYRYYSWGNW